MKILVLIFFVGFFYNNLFGQLQNNSYKELSIDEVLIKEMKSASTSDGILTINYSERQPDESRGDFRNRRRKARAAARGMERQGFIPSRTYGTAYSQYMRICWMITERTWIFESKKTYAYGTNAINIATSKARIEAREKLIRNLGEWRFDPLEERGENYEYSGAAEIIVVANFYKKEDHKVTVFLVIAMNMDGFNTNLNIPTQELKDLH